MADVRAVSRTRTNPAAARIVDPDALGSVGSAGCVGTRAAVADGCGPGRGPSYCGGARSGNARSWGGLGPADR